MKSQAINVITCQTFIRQANNESSEVFVSIKPGQKVKIKGNRQ